MAVIGNMGEIKMKKNRVAIIIVSAIIIVWGGYYYYPSNTKNLKLNPESTEELEKLLKTFGFIKPPFTPLVEEVVLYDLNKKPVKLADYKGSIVFINFWATWCPPCREEMPAMQKLYDRYKKEPFHMIAVSIKESPAQVKAFFKEKKLSFTALIDPKGAVGKKFAINSIPTTFILDKNGNVIGKALGPRDWGSRKSHALFEHLVKI